jgi:hypothetical protein
MAAWRPTKIELNLWFSKKNRKIERVGKPGGAAPPGGSPYQLISFSLVSQHIYMYVFRFYCGLSESTLALA